MNNILNEINAQLSVQRLFIKSGGLSIIDVSVIETNKCRPNKNKDAEAIQVPEVEWNVKAGTDGKIMGTYCIKVYLSVDEDEFIKRGSLRHAMYMNQSD